MADLSVKLPKPKYGQIVVLQKNGDEPRGNGFPIISSTCVIGRCESADIRVSSADVSMTHCKICIDEVTGEATLEIIGSVTEVNGDIVDPNTKVSLNHKDVILIGGRKLRFEYLPPDYKPLPSKPIAEVLTDSFKAEVVDREENGEVVENGEEEECVPEVPSTPATKRVSFGPYLSPEQFDNTLPPATPVKKGATPRRSTRYSGLKFTRSTIDPLIEEEVNVEALAEKQTTEEEMAECDRFLVEESIVTEEQEAEESVSSSADDTTRESPTLASAGELSDLPTPANTDVSSMDAMSTMSDISNIAVVPSENCSFLDEPIDEDFGSEIGQQEESTMGESTLFENEDLIGNEPVAEILSTSVQSGSTINDKEEEGITLSPPPEEIVDEENGEVAEEDVKSKASKSPKCDYTDVKGVKKLMATPKPVPPTPKADYTNVAGIKELMKTPKPPQKEPESDYTNVEGVQDLLKTPKASTDANGSSKTPKQAQIPNAEEVQKTPKASKTPKSQKTPKQVTEVETEEVDDQLPSPEKSPEVIEAVVDEEELLKSPQIPESSKDAASEEEVPISQQMETGPKLVASNSPKADYTDVRGVKQLLQTPKPAPATPKADYSNVSGVKRLLRTPKHSQKVQEADYSDVEGVRDLLKTPKVTEDKKETEMETLVGSPEKSPEVESEANDKELVDQSPSAVNAQGEEEDAETLKSDKFEISTKELEGAKVIVAISHEADYTDVRGVKQLLQTPKPAPVTPKADYSNVSGVKRLMKTPKAAATTPKADYSNVEGIELLMKTPKAVDEEVTEKTIRKPSVSPDSGCQTPSMETPLEPVDAAEFVNDIEEGLQKSDGLEVESEETVKVVEETPRRGRKGTPRVATPKPRSRREKMSSVLGAEAVEKIEEEEDNVEETVDVPQVAEETKEETVVEAGPTPKSNTQRPKRAKPEPELEEEIEKSTETLQVTENVPPVEEEPAKVEEESTSHPRRGRKSAATPKPRSKKNQSEAEVEGEIVQEPTEIAPVTATLPAEEETKEEPAKVEDEAATSDQPDKATTSQPEVEVQEEKETQELVKEDVEEKEDEAPRRGRKTAPATKVDSSKSRAKRGKLEVEEINEPTEEDVPPVEEEEPAKEEDEAPRRGRKTAPTAKANSPKSRSKRAKMEVEEPADEPTETKPVDQDVAAVVEETPLTEEPSSPPRRGRRATPKTNTPKPRAKRTPAKLEEPVEEEADQQVVEDEPVVEAPKETPKPEVPSTPRRGRRTAPTPTTNTPKSTKRKQLPSDSDNQEEEVEAEHVDTPVKRGRAKKEKKGTVKPQAKKSKRQSDSAEETEVAEEPVVDVNIEEEEVKSVSSPRRGRRAAPKVETPKTKPVDGPSEETEEVEASGSRPVRSKRKPDGLIAGIVSSMTTTYPVVRLTRYTQQKEEEKRTSTSSVEDATESKSVPAKRGRGQAKAVGDAVAETEPQVRRTTARGRGKKEAESGNSTDDTDSDAQPKKTATRRVAAKRNADSLETVPEEKRRRGTKAVALDDVEMMHEGKGHAADIHVNHLPDDEEQADTSPIGPRSTRNKKGLKVHFDIVEPEVAKSPAKKTRTTKKPVVMLKRDPDIESMAAGVAVKEEEDTKATKRPRQKKATVAAAPAVAESPTKPAAKRPTRGKKATNEPVQEPEEEAAPVAAPPSPRRTRRTRI